MSTAGLRYDNDNLPAPPDIAHNEFRRGDPRDSGTGGGGEVSPEIGERVARLEALAENTRDALARIERAVETGFGAARQDVGRLERDLKGNFDKLDVKIDGVRKEVLDDNKGNRRLIAWTMAGLFVAAVAAIWLTNQLVMQAIDLGRPAADQARAVPSPMTAPAPPPAVAPRAATGSPPG